MQSMLVIGLGRFGSHLAESLAEFGNEVMCIDKDEELIRAISDTVTDAQIGDCTDEDVIKALDVSQYDVCFVCMGEDLQASLEITSLLKENGAKCVVSKANRDIHRKFLEKIGADHVVNPERDMARRVAMRYSANNVFDYFRLGEGYAVFEMETPEAWVGRSALQLNVRSAFNVNIIAVKSEGTLKMFTDAERPFVSGEHLIIAGSDKDITKLCGGKKTPLSAVVANRLRR